MHCLILVQTISELKKGVESGDLFSDFEPDTYSASCRFIF